MASGTMLSKLYSGSQRIKRVISVDDALAERYNEKYDR